MNLDSEIQFEDDQDDESDSYLDLDEGEEILFVDENLPPVVMIECWRCGKSISMDLRQCPHCQAVRSGQDVEETPRKARRSPTGAPRTEESGTGLVRLFWFYGGILSTSILGRVLVMLSAPEKAPNKAENIDALLGRMGLLECVDVLIILVACAVIRPQPSGWWKGYRRAIVAWLASVPLIVGLLALNFAYFWFLKNLLKLGEIEDTIVSVKGLSPLVVLIFCIQPAIFEELFFRYLAIGELRPLVGTHSAILISSVMFGLAHIGNPLGIPVLTVIGMGLGYSRVWGGSLLLPIVLHFVHNYAVLSFQNLL